MGIEKKRDLIWLSVVLICISLTIVAASCKTGDDDDDKGDDTAGDDDTAASDDAGDDVPDATDPDVQCAAIEDPESNQACRDCVIQCNLALQSGFDLSQGPCLNEQVDPGWACDVVHSPRLPVDDLVQNQCVQYPSLAPHKVEVSPTCDFLALL